MAIVLALVPLSGTAAPTPNQIAEYFDAGFAIERQQHELVGAVVAVVDDGAVVFQKGYGFANLETRTLADPEQSLFRIASITKTFVWTAVMQLVEAGKLDLDADIGTYLDFEIPDSFDAPIRLRDLLTHSPGFEELGTGTSARAGTDLIPLGKFLAEHGPTRVRPPGQFSAYSNYGTALAGYIVERVSGERWDEYVENHILATLGMTSTTARQPLPRDLEARRAVGYTFKDGRFEPAPFMLNHDAPAGAMSTTAADMARYMLAHLQLGRLGDARILREDTARRMQSELFRHDEAVLPFLHGFYRSDRNGISIFGHGGDVNQFHSQMSLLPDEGLGVFVSFNSDPGAEARTHLINAFVDRFFPGDLLPAPPAPAANAPLDDYTGEYALMRRNHSTFEKAAVLASVFTVSSTDDGHLRLTGAGPTTRWAPLGEDRFRALYSETKLVFVRDQTGRVAHALISTIPTSALERLSRWESPAQHQAVFAIVALFAAAAVFGYGYRTFARAPEPRLPRIDVAIAWLLGLLILILLVGLLRGLSTDTDEFAYGVPEHVAILLRLGVVALVLGVVVAALSVKQFVGARGTAAARVRYAGVAAAGLVFAWQLWFWNLLG